VRLFPTLLSLGLLIGASGAQALDLDQWAGAYRVQHKIADIPQQKMVDAENILEIVKHSPNTAYIRFRLLFTNGHSCSAFGIAEAEGDALIYRADETVALGKICTIRFEPKDGKITLSHLDGPEDRCRRFYCGANGTIEGATFPQVSKRKITYTDRILQSWQYKEAVEEYEQFLRKRASASPEAKQP
jgi:hypothetical protein